MNTIAEFTDDCHVKVITRRGEELKGTFRAPIKQKKNREKAIVLITHAFDVCDTMVEARNLIAMSCMNMAELMVFGGVVFDYIVAPSEADRKRIGATIRKLREDKDLTARELSFLAHIDPANLSRIEQGKHAVGIDTLNKLAYYLDAEVQIVPTGSTSKTNRIYHYE